MRAKPGVVELIAAHKTASPVPLEASVTVARHSLLAPHHPSPGDSAAGALSEGIVAFPLDVYGGCDQRQVAERLGIIAQQHAAPRIDLF